MFPAEAFKEENENIPPGFTLLARSMGDLGCGPEITLPEGTSFADILRGGAGFISLSHTFRLSNPDKGRSLARPAGEARDEAQPAARPKGPESCPQPAEGRIFVRPSRKESDDFKSLCRLFGRRFSEVEAFAIKNTMTFVPDHGAGRDNTLSYQLGELVMALRYEGPVTAFFELVRNRGGNNFVLYWETLPDILGEMRSGEARGCTLFWEALAVREVISDDARAAAELPFVLPTIERLSALIRRLYRR